MACGRKQIAGLLMLFAAVSSYGRPASAATQEFGPFKYDKAVPTIIILDGEIDERSALNFRQVLRAAKQAKTLILKSPGGLVSEALLIADDVQQRDLATLIPPSAQCFSACAFIFLAGADRMAMGALGVHQISSDLPDLERAQLAISDIIDALDRFGAPAGVLTTMFRTSADQMHVFSQEEIALYGINRTRESSGGIASQQETMPGVPPDLPEQVTAETTKPPIGSDSPLSRLPVPEPASRPSLPQQAVFYQEKTESDVGTSEGGSVSWSIVKGRGPIGEPLVPTIEAKLEIPSEGMLMTMIIRRNDDSALPASHIIQLKFNSPDRLPGIANVQRLALKVSEEARGDPLIGVAERVSHNSFIIALNNIDGAKRSNLALLQERPWIDIPIAYSTGRRALISIDKGSPGDDVFREAFRLWRRSKPLE